MLFKQKYRFRHVDIEIFKLLYIDEMRGKDLCTDAFILLTHD